METINKSFVLSFEKEKDELRKVQKKKRKFTTDCDNPTSIKENIYKKQKLDKGRFQ